MTRNLTVALVLALFAAAPAGAQTIRIAVAGKTAAQIDKEIRVAAQDVCWTSYASMPTPLSAYSACVKAQVKSAQAQLRTGALAQVSTDKLLR